MKSLDIGYINKNNQKNLGYRGKSETHYNQNFFEMECLECGHKYLANGCDVWLRKCPMCQAQKAPGKKLQLHPHRLRPFLQKAVEKFRTSYDIRF